jgi:hypothetical protein
MDHDISGQLLGRAAAAEFALGSIMKHLPAEAREAIQADLKTFMERSDTSHASGQAVADAAESILKESGATVP